MAMTNRQLKKKLKQRKKLLEKLEKINWYFNPKSLQEICDHKYTNGTSSFKIVAQVHNTNEKECQICGKITHV